MKRLIVLLTIFAIIIPETSCSRRSRAKDSSDVDIVHKTERRNGVDQATLPVDAVPQAAPAKITTTIKIFVENSGSMNGYINSSSEFQSAIQKMVVLLSNYYGSDHIQLNYVNKDVYNKPVPSGSPISGVIEGMLSLNQFAGSGSGSHGDTNLNDIIRMVLEKTDADCVSILISDFLYSVGSGDQTPAMLASCQFSTMEHFLNKSHQVPSLSTLVIQLSSSFQGKYWDYTSRRHNLRCKRPYYMCVIGSASHISDLNSHIKIDEIEGFKEKILLSSVNLRGSNYSVLSATNRKGRFVTGGNQKREISRVELSTQGNEFQFSIGMDLSDFPLTEAEKLNMANYCVEKGNFEVVDVRTIDPMYIKDPSDKSIIESRSLTHLLTLRLSKLPISDCRIKIKMELPQWVKEDSSSDDKNIETDVNEQSKSFGIYYFINGIFDAYSEVSNGDNGYLVMDIKINKKI